MNLSSRRNSVGQHPAARVRGLARGVAACLVAALAGCSKSPPPTVDFNRDIRPILTKSCMACHGGVRKQGGISFVFRDEAMTEGASGRRAIVPGKPDASELIARLESDDPEFRMPHHAPPLSAEEIDLFRTWIEQGASWNEHWAFVAPAPQTPPAVKHESSVRSPIDRFILARLESEGLAPAREADKAALLRRVSFDLTGLPPTPAELQSFLDDQAPEAYEKQVDRLLASEHFGERWAAVWLDLARYADSRGFEKDKNRPGVWVYRDWVVNAFNRNLPYDRFVTLQLAGDLDPEATLEHRIATAFNRLTPANDEAGTDDEEYRTVAVMDRAATAWAALNGFTMNCVQCHSHPYDPVRHEDYYRFLAFFNNTRDADLPNDTPSMPVPKNPADYAAADATWRELQGARVRLVDASRHSVEAEGAKWIAAPVVAARSDAVAALEREIEFANGEPEVVAELKAVLTKLKAEPNSVEPKFRLHDGEAITVGTGRNVTIYEYDVVPKAGVLTALRVDFLPLNPVEARSTPEEGFIVDRIFVSRIGVDGRQTPIAMGAYLPDSVKNVDFGLLNLLKQGPRADIREMARLYRAPIAGADAGKRLLAVGGVEASSKITAPRWTVAIPAAPVTLAEGDRLRVRTEQLTPQERNPTVRRVRVAASAETSWSQIPTALETVAGEVVASYNRLARIDNVALPVMEECAPAERRETRLFERGNMLTKTGAALTPGMPKSFPQIEAGKPADRLAMARAFFAPDEPLTARVAVNRFWEQLFGLGLVETLEDFGSAGLPPSHPQLLDWLALRYQNDLKWNTKALLRELVLTATYRQDARTTPELIEKDPRNRLLARGPRQRLTAEMVRDQALAASGLLTPTLGGPPVMPPQPEGVWKVVYSKDVWTDATGPDRYRRALYTFIKRSAVYPSLITFDAPAHEVSVARRIPTNTPLQALVTLNDPVYSEAARALAKRVLTFPASELPRAGEGATDETTTRLNYAGRLVLSRDLTAEELADVRAYHDSERRSRSSLQAMSAVAALLLNLDAAMIR
ncbi:MAG TPA: PSD1 and planctomycete cytochrome C domain-containing protein [Steroidobacteraceae bacterium]|nr:PSD1 and planctomycete cytochrome C domain-containing protein [Steroidobacteraceae bacterium]